MITPQHYVVRGLQYIHPDVLDEACEQGRYVAEHFARAILFMGCVAFIALWLIHAEGDFTRGLLLTAWGIMVAMLYMHYVFEHIPIVPSTEPPDPGAEYEPENLAEYCEVFSL